MSSRTETGHQALPNGYATVLRTHPVATKNLPEPTVIWDRVTIAEHSADPEAVRRVIKRFTEFGIIRRHGIQHRNGQNYRQYSTHPAAYEYDVSGRDVWPCGHTGLRNLGDGRYTCLNDECEKVYDKATALEVFTDG